MGAGGGERWGWGGGGRGLLTGGISDNLFLENNLFKNQADLN